LAGTSAPATQASPASSHGIGNMCLATCGHHPRKPLQH